VGLSLLPDPDVLLVRAADAALTALRSLPACCWFAPLTRRSRRCARSRRSLATCVTVGG